MAKVTFTSDINIKPQRQTFPKLSGLKTGEKVRIQLMSTDGIETEFVHNLEVPIIDNGAGVFDDKGKPKTSYKGSPLSFGDYSILEEKGLDPKNCPMSKMAKEHPDWVSPPRRKFAMHIIKYRTKPGSFDVAKPFQVEHKVWVFTEKTFLKLRDLENEWGDLRKHDLYITCENEKFQQFDIQVAPRAEWMQDKETAAHAVEVYEAGKEQYPDLALAIGQRKEREWVIKDLEDIEEAWGIISGKGDASFGAGGDLSSLLDSSGGEDDSGDTDDNILAGLADSGPSKSSSDEPDDFESLLKGLGQ